MSTSLDPSVRWAAVTFVTVGAELAHTVELPNVSNPIPANNKRNIAWFVDLTSPDSGRENASS
jgi:hypothetical protein